MSKEPQKTSAKTKILDAALTVIRRQGYAATSVDDLCEAAGVTKGAFFHHFKSKEDLAVTAAQYWSSVTNALFEAAPYRRHADPLDRVLGYVDFRKSLLQGSTAEFTCFVGTMVQETFATNPAIREACQSSIFGHSSDIAKDIQEAKKLYAPQAKWSSKSLGLYIQAVLQGSFILAKSDQDAKVAAENIDHLRTYIELLFQPLKSAKK
jgi:TetR/AcrR family transcriptional repressor of nem operon